jgi:hypothetical protein
LLLRANGVFIIGFRQLTPSTMAKKDYCLNQGSYIRRRSWNANGAQGPTALRTLGAAIGKMCSYMGLQLSDATSGLDNIYIRWPPCSGRRFWRSIQYCRSIPSWVYMCHTNNPAHTRNLAGLLWPRQHFISPHF